MAQALPSSYKNGPRIHVLDWRWPKHQHPLYENGSWNSVFDRRWSKHHHFRTKIDPKTPSFSYEVRSRNCGGAHTPKAPTHPYENTQRPKLQIPLGHTVDLGFVQRGITWPSADKSGVVNDAYRQISSGQSVLIMVFNKAFCEIVIVIGLKVSFIISISFWCNTSNTLGWWRWI